MACGQGFEVSYLWEIERRSGWLDSQCLGSASKTNEEQPLPLPRSPAPHPVRKKTKGYYLLAVFRHFSLGGGLGNRFTLKMD